MIDISFVQLRAEGYEYASDDSDPGDYTFFMVEGIRDAYVYPPGEHYDSESTRAPCYILDNDDTNFYFAINQEMPYNLVTFKGEVFKIGQRKGRVKSCYYKKDLEPRRVPASKARKNVRKRA
jgi:hypothetical protein